MGDKLWKVSQYSSTLVPKPHTRSPRVVEGPSKWKFFFRKKTHTNTHTHTHKKNSWRQLALGD